MMTSTFIMRRTTRSGKLTDDANTLNDKKKRARVVEKSDIDCDFESIEKKIFEDVGKVSTPSIQQKSISDEKLWSKVSESITGKRSKTEETRTKSFKKIAVNIPEITKSCEKPSRNGEVKSHKAKNKVELNKKSDIPKIKSSDCLSNSSNKSSKKISKGKAPMNDEKSVRNSSKRKIDKNTLQDDNKLEKKSKSLKTEQNKTKSPLIDEATTQSKSLVPSKTKEPSHKKTKEHISMKNKKVSSIKKSNPRSKSSGDLQKKNSSESEMSDWEDVDHGTTHIKKNTASNEMELLMKEEDDMEEAESSRIQIELDAPTLWGMKKRKKRKTEEEMIEDYLRKSVNQGIRESYANCHKVHLLLLLGHGQHLNKILNSEEVLAAALSIVTNKLVYPPKRTNIEYIEKLVKWYIAKVNFVNGEIKVCSDWKVLLLQRFGEKGAKSKKEFVLMFVVLCRALGMSVRLVQSLAPLSWKPTAEKLFKPKKSREDEDIDCEKLKEVKPIDVVKPKKKNKMISSDSEEEKKQPPAKKKKDSKKTLKREKISDDSDSDFEERVKSTKRIKGLQNKTVKFLMQVENGKESKKGRVDASAFQKRKDTISEWVEIYVEDVEGWVCVDVIKSKIYCSDEFATRVPPPVSYITAFNPDQTVKDVTKRYVSKWLSDERKLRCDSEWWTEVLRRYSPPLNSRERKENEALEENLRKQPLPKTISEFKNHPMYALQRHLLKYEALYPPNPDPLGFIRGEPVFPRECVKTLHSRDVWLKQAKTVIVDEEAYKVVTAMPKWDRVACKLIKDRPLDLFGEWQVENYKPPVAKDGKVPRNEYGNVELFKPEMLPIGCVHLNSYFEDLSRICRKLKIDCAPAMVGFDFHKGGTHPVFDGYVICVEFEEILKDAWKEEMELKRKREESRRQKRVLDNWKRMTKSLLVKHHVREVYGDYNSDCEEKGSNKEKVSVPSKKRKVIKQKDIESARESAINVEEKVELGIDLKSDTVTMAKKCIKTAQTSRGAVEVDSPSKKKRMIESSDEDEDNKLTEEQKKEKLRNILNWGKFNAEHETGLGLSDDSDAESSPDNEYTTNIGLNAADLITNYKSIKQSSIGGKTRTFIKKRAKSEAESEIDDNEESDNSTDFEESVSLQVASGSRRPKRKAVKKAKVIVESEDEDISLGESDFDDKTYKPEINVSVVKVKQRSMLSDDSD